MIAAGLPVRHVAYFVADVPDASFKHHQLCCSAPFFVGEHIHMRASVHRGTSRSLDHTSAYGQWGDFMGEFVQQNNPGPSAFHDLYPHGSKRYGLHHVAVFVEDRDRGAARLQCRGLPNGFLCGNDR